MMPPVFWFAAVIASRRLQLPSVAMLSALVVTGMVAAEAAEIRVRLNRLA